MAKSAGIGRLNGFSDRFKVGMSLAMAALKKAMLMEPICVESNDTVLCSLSMVGCSTKCVPETLTECQPVSKAAPPTERQLASCRWRS